MAKIVYVEWRESRELDILGVYENEDVAYRIRENNEYELKEQGYDTDEDVRVWIENVDIVYDDKSISADALEYITIHNNNPMDYTYAIMSVANLTNEELFEYLRGAFGYKYTSEELMEIIKEYRKETE